MIPLKASDCISPAFQHTVRQMFKPFRLKFWLRMALLGLLTGELSGGGCNNGFRGFNAPGGSSHPGSTPMPAGLPWHMPHFTMAEIALTIAVVVALFFGLMLLFLYLNSVLRFVLFESILNGDTRIVEGWRKWRETGRKYFVWQLLLAALSLAMACVLIGIPVVLLISRGLLHFHPFQPRVLLYLLPGFLAFLLYSFGMAIVTVLAKDFMVPIMALEGVGWKEAWPRTWVMAKAEPGSYVIYILLKIALRIAAAIAHGIAFFIVAVVVAIPVVILVIMGVAMGVGATLAVKALLITLGIVIGILLLLVMIAISAFIGSPIAFFFPAYSIFFFGSRYEPLRKIVFPAPPPIPPQAPPAFA